MKKLLVFSVLFFLLVGKAQPYTLSLMCGESHEKFVCLDNSHPPGIYLFKVEKPNGCFSMSEGDKLKVFCSRDGVIVQMIDHVRLDQQIKLEVELKE